MSITLSNGAERTELVTDSTTTGLDLFGNDRTVVAVRVNGELRDLHRELPEGADVETVSIDSPDGRDILRHSTAHVLAQAVQELVPEGPARDRAADHRRLLLRLRRGRARSPPRTCASSRRPDAQDHQGGPEVLAAARSPTTRRAPSSPTSPTSSS